MCHYVSEDLQLQEVLIGFKPITGSQTCWNLAQIVDKILQKQSLSKGLFTVAEDNASHNNTMRHALQAALHSQCTEWGAEAMTIFCLTHVSKLSVKTML
jgi:hypothetical protein